jgi:oligoendopeptidase F
MTTPSWDLSIAYSGFDDLKIEQDISAVQHSLRFLEKKAEQLCSVSVLQQALISKESAMTLLATLGTFAMCHESVDAKDTVAKQLSGRINRLSSALTQAFSPYQDKLIHCDTNFLAQVLADTSVAPHAFLIKDQRELVDSRLSVKEEQLITAMSVDGKDAWGRLYSNITGSMQVTLKLADGTTEILGFSQAASILYGADRKRREPAWRAIQVAMAENQESFSAILNALSGWRLTEYSKRSHTKPMHFLDPSLHANRIEQATLESMLAVAKKNRAVGQKAGRLMAKMFATSSLKPWDQLAAMPPLMIAGNNAGNSAVVKTYSFAEAIEIIKEAFTGVDPAMGSFVDTMVTNNWIDAAPQPNKRLGAFCTKFAGTRTPLVFMTWGGSMSDVITLAHELGHAFHNWVMQDMPLCETRYPMTLAETASIFAENIVRDSLFEKASSNEQRIEMLWQEISSALALLVNIPVRFEFEKKLYEQRQNNELTAEQLCNLMADTWQEWYGDAMTEVDEYFWASKLHFSIAGLSFYNYPYLFGYLFSKGVYAQRAVKGEQFYGDYVALLRDTGRMKAEDVVRKHLNLDLTQADFWQQSLDMVSEQIDKFEALLAV